MDPMDMVKVTNTMRLQNRMDHFANGSIFLGISLVLCQDSLLFESIFHLRPHRLHRILRSVPESRYRDFEVFSALFCAFIVEVIMQIRLHALYGHDKQLIFVVSLLCIGELMSMASLSITKFPTAFAGLAQVPNSVWILPFCNNVIPNHFYPYWIAFMIFDMIVLLLVARKAYIHYQTLPDKDWSNATLMAVLLRDSVLYFLCNVVVFLGTTLLWRYGPQGLATVANSWSLVVPASSANRLLLNMRSAYKPASDRVSTAGLSGLGSLHIICPDSRGTGSEGESYFDSDDTSDDHSRK
ncbi:hypothetical protein B0H19DRAFT_214843 [Mycena capillaripes]|nr:hypothetical protein B0H19DRAFT_214843 [Mycena capillaripes]